MEKKRVETKPDKKVGKLGTPVPKSKICTSAKVARSRVKKASSPAYLPGKKKLSNKYMRVGISALFTTPHPNTVKKDWVKIAIDIRITLQTDFRIIERVIEKIASSQDAEARNPRILEVVGNLGSNQACPRPID